MENTSKEKYTLQSSLKRKICIISCWHNTKYITKHSCTHRGNVIAKCCHIGRRYSSMLFLITKMALYVLQFLVVNGIAMPNILVESLTTVACSSILRFFSMSILLHIPKQFLFFAFIFCRILWVWTRYVCYTILPPLFFFIYNITHKRIYSYHMYAYSAYTV